MSCPIVISRLRVARRHVGASDALLPSLTEELEAWSEFWVALNIQFSRHYFTKPSSDIQNYRISLIYRDY